MTDQARHETREARARGRRFFCQAVYSASPDLDPEPLYRCLGPEDHDPPHSWDMAHPWFLDQRRPFPSPIPVIFREAS